MKKILMLISIGSVIVLSIFLTYAFQRNGLLEEANVNKLIDNTNDTVISTSLFEGEKICEINDKIYFSDGNNIYEISNDLSNSKILLTNSDSFIINDNVLYTNKESVNLTNGIIKELKGLIYLDNEIQILHPKENTFKILNRVSNFEKEIELEGGEFYKRIDDKLFFHQNMIDYSCLYYIDVNNLDLQIINREERKKLWSDIDGKLGFDFERITERWQLKEFMTIDSLKIINNKIYYSYYVSDCDLSGTGVGAGGYDERIIEIDLNGDNKRICAQATVGEGPTTISSGANFSQIFKNHEESQSEEVQDKGFIVEFDKDYFCIFNHSFGIKNSIVAKIENPKPNTNTLYDGHLLEEFGKDYWYEENILELENYVYIRIDICTTIGWRNIVATSQEYFLKKDGSSIFGFKDGKLYEVKNEYGANDLVASLAENEAVFINSIIPNEDGFLVKATIYEPYSLTKVELEEKMDKNEPICIDGILYKVVKLNNEYCLKSDIDDNYVNIDSEGKMFITWGDPRADVWSVWAYKITDKKVEFLLDEDAVLTGNQFIAPIKEIYDEWWAEDETYIQTEDKFITFADGIYHTFFDPETGKCAELGSSRIGG